MWFFLINLNPKDECRHSVLHLQETFTVVLVFSRQSQSNRPNDKIKCPPFPYRAIRRKYLKFERNTRNPPLLARSPGLINLPRAWHTRSFFTRP